MRRRGVKSDSKSSCRPGVKLGQPPPMRCATLQVSSFPCNIIVHDGANIAVCAATEHA